MRNLIDDGVEASARKSQAHFQISRVSSSAEPRMRLEKSENLPEISLCLGLNTILASIPLIYIAKSNGYLVFSPRNNANSRLQTACLVFNPIMVEGYAALFSCIAAVSMMAPTFSYSFLLVGTGALRLLLGPPRLN